MHLIEIDGVIIDCVSSYKVSARDVVADSGGESETGYTIRDIVRENVYSLSLSLCGNFMQIKKALSLINKEHFNVKFLDPNTGNMTTAEMFRDSPESEIAYLNGDRGIWQTSVGLKEF